LSHYTKSFSTFARDYGIQEASGLLQVVPAVVPVSIVDDVREYLHRTYSEHSGRGTMAATAAVFGMIGLRAGANPIVVRIFADVGLANTVTTNLVYSIADLRTANQTTSTVVNELTRGDTSVGATILQGTTTVVATGFMMSDGVPTADQTNLQRGMGDIYLKPAEGIWLAAGTVNEAIDLSVLWYELQLPNLENPEAL